jgi:hypothetical protein
VQAVRPLSVSEPTPCREPHPRRRFSYAGHKKIEDGWCYWHDEQSFRQLFENALPGCRPKARDGEDDGDTMQYLIAFLKSHLALLAATMARDLAFAFQKLN